MKHSATKKILVLAFCTTSLLCYGQQNRSAVCRLGEITNDSLLPFIETLEIEGNDAPAFSRQSGTFNSLKTLVIKNETNPENWKMIYAQIRLSPELQTVIFDANSFERLPEGFNSLFAVPELIFRNNDELDHTSLFEQLSELPNLRELTVDIYSIFDLPKDISILRNLKSFHMINTDESISAKQANETPSEKEAITYDYLMEKPDKRFVAVKYTALAGEIDSDEYKELAKRFTTNFNMTATTGYVPKYVNVNPPIKGIDVQRQTVTINNSIENILTYPSGTKIRIPANAFVDKNGIPVEGSVKFGYREFRDPVEILVSGIPMTYDTAGEVNDFESAGMFEMTASVNSEPVQLANDKKIDMNFKTTSQDSTFNFYSFDDKTGNWQYLEKPKTVTPATKIDLKPLTQAYQAYRRYVLYNREIYDSTDFASRFTNSNYVYTNLQENAVRMPYRRDGKPREKPMKALVRISKVRKTKEGTVLFKIDYIHSAHPEMQEFNDVYFALTEPITAAEFRLKYAKRKYYNDVRIVSSGGDVEVQLKNNQSIQTISASLVQLDSKGKIKEIRTGSKMKRYNKRLRNRERLFNRKLAKGRLDNNRYDTNDPDQLSVYAYNAAKKLMTSDEKKMNFSEWKDYCKQLSDRELDGMRGIQVDANTLTQSLSVSGIGIYNCDQIRRISDPVEVFASYKSGEGNKMTPTQAYIIDKKRNSAFSYAPGKIIFSRSPNAENTLIVINQDGSLSVAGPQAFRGKEFHKWERHSFDMVSLVEKPMSVDDLKVLIGF